MESLLRRIEQRFPSLAGSELNVKYLDGSDWIVLPSDDLDSFIDLIETAKPERENLRRITLQVNKVAFTPPVSHCAVPSQKEKRLYSALSPSGKYQTAESQNAGKKHKLSETARCLEGEFSQTNDESQYETPTQIFLKGLRKRRINSGKSWPKSRMNCRNLRRVSNRQA